MLYLDCALSHKTTQTSTHIVKRKTHTGPLIIRAIITFMSAIYSLRSGYGRSSSPLLKSRVIIMLYLIQTELLKNNTSLWRCKQIILVHIGFLSVDMDYPVYHLATISCVWWHVIGVLIVVRVCFRNWWMDRGIWKKQKTKREMDINHFFFMLQQTHRYKIYMLQKLYFLMPIIMLRCKKHFCYTIHLVCFCFHSV